MPEARTFGSDMAAGMLEEGGEAGAHCAAGDEGAMPSNQASGRAARGDAASELLPIELENVDYAIGGTTVIEGLNLVLAEGPLTVLMGPNGAGKTMLLRLLQGLVAPTSGRITWGGTLLSRQKRVRLGLVFQKPVLLRRSVAANIAFAVGLRGRVRAGEVRAHLAAFDLAALSDRPARGLSGGEQQRLALARALALAPRVLLLDEPTASLDPASTRLIERHVLEAARNGIKIVFVTHDIGQARRLADEVIFLHRGRICEQSPAKHFFERPQSAAARAYLAGEILA